MILMAIESCFPDIQEGAAAPSWISGKHDSIAIRITQKDPIPYLQSVLGSPIVSTSANFHGGAELKSLKEVQKTLSGVVDLIFEGTLDAKSKPSRIVDILTNEIIRGHELFHL